MENRYLFDTNIIIDIGQRYYPRDVFSDLWEYVYQQIDLEVILILDMVAKEIKEKINDPDANRNSWRDEFLDRADSLKLIKSGNYQENFAYLADKCQNDRNYRGEVSQQNVGKFLAKADVWIIAAAKAEGCTIVTREGLASLQIPRVCKLEKIRCITPLEYFREANLKFNLQL